MKHIRTIVFIIILLGSFGLSAFIPYQKIFYAFFQRTPIKVLNNREVDFGYEGRIADKSVPVVNSVEGLLSESYLVIEAESIESTELYGLIDMSKAGEHTVGARRQSSRRVIPYWTESKWTVLINDMDFARYYVATLSDNSKIIILIDDTTFTWGEGGKIRLPIGKITQPITNAVQSGRTFRQYFKDNAERFELEETDWYVNMTSLAFYNMYQLPVMIIRALVAIIIGVSSCYFLNKIFFTKK